VTARATRLVFVIGTRPEAIKLAPLILGAGAPRFAARVVTTSQHREMLDPILEEFGIRPDLDLAIMRPDQDPAQVTTAALRGLDDALARLEPDCVVVQGDTTSTFAGALAAFYRRAPVAHVEAGLRTGDPSRPWPEEMNRRLTAQLARYHFAPTPRARENLLREGVDPAQIWVTGNTAIDALLWCLGRAPRRAPGAAGGRRTLLVTAHRRENHGPPLERICQALLRLVEELPDLEVSLPMHLSPRVRATLIQRLEGHPRIALGAPLGYAAFVRAMQAAHVLLTDSGGVQEEAPTLGVPVLVMRETTERPEAVEAGSARLVGTDPERIVAEVSRLFRDPAQHQRMATAVNPYGDGKAAGRILDALAERLAAPGDGEGA
jgi:UDP-N-acetylglucosamine 2-epimerase (non-hydrolysing)